MMQLSVGVRRWRHDGLFRKVQRLGFLVAGLFLLGWVVHLVQTDRVVAVVRGAAPWVPVVGLLEIGVAVTDLLAFRLLLGVRGRNVRALTWFRSSALAYVSSVLLPAGRAAGEATRAVVLSPALGAAWAVATGARLQACALLGNTAISVLVVVALVSAGQRSRWFETVLLANALVCAVLGTALLLALGNARLRRWLRGRLAGASPIDEVQSQTRLQRSETCYAVLLCLVGRIVQTVQCAVLLHAVGSAVTPMRAAAAQGIRLVGAAVGDVIPNQLGVTEGAYLAFSRGLGMAEAPERTVAIPLLIHVVQLVVAAVSALAAGLVVDHPAGDPT
jgi:hypothetical protein